MPELPEVETIARTLAPEVSGRSLVAVRLHNPGTWQGGIPPEAVCASGPRRITGTGRRGKVLLLHFAPAPDIDSGASDDIRGLAFHLKMTGRVLVQPPGAEPGPHTRVEFTLDHGDHGDRGRLFFDDMRKFGYVRALSPAELAAWEFWQTLGPEPLELDDETFLRLFKGRGRAMKALLLDQTVIAGIGNIYADESLFRAGIAPATPASALDDAALLKLRHTLREVLEEAIAACGSSIRDYRTAHGDAGAFQNKFRVYGRGGQSCVICGATLAHGRIAGRSTVYCPVCQPQR